MTEQKKERMFKKNQAEVLKKVFGPTENICNAISPNGLGIGKWVREYAFNRGRVTTKQLLRCIANRLSPGCVHFGGIETEKGGLIYDHRKTLEGNNLPIND